MMTGNPSLHSISEKILASGTTNIVKIEPHDPNAESADILWTEHDPDSIYVGEAIYVSLVRTGNWCVSFETVYATSDTATSEMFLGPEDDVVQDVLAALIKSSKKGGN